MKYRQLKLVRKQLDSTLIKYFAKPAITNRPIKGWIRAIRDALGMNMRQLAQRMGVSQSRIAKIEEDELSGALTIKTLERVAEQIDCKFVYGFAPKSKLELAVKKQAICIAQERMNNVAHHMLLESQNLDRYHTKVAFDNMVEEILESPSKLWDKIY
jgi:predicted DNA-binding mobile mystery protein A